jgi:cephalosporin hydroxylase
MPGRFSPLRVYRAAILLLRDPAEFRRRARRKYFPMSAPSRREYRQRFRLTLEDWMLYHQTDIVFDQCTWMGVKALKNPLDAWIYQEIIYEVKPDVIVELGSMWGGSTLYLANLLDLLGHGQVVSVDINRERFSAKHERFVLITGSTTDPEVIAKVRALCEGRRALFIHDAAHDKPTVLADLRTYSNLVSVGSYFIVEDGFGDLFTPGTPIGMGEDGPLPAIEEFTREHPEFVVDKSRERYLLTTNPLGFLKRTR